MARYGTCYGACYTMARYGAFYVYFIILSISYLFSMREIVFGIVLTDNIYFINIYVLFIIQP